MAKKKTKAKKQSKSKRKTKIVKKVSKGTSRFRSVQKILSEYTRSNGIKLGRSFNKIAGEIHRKSGGTPLKYISQNIEQLYKETSGAEVVKVEFPDNFPFYGFIDKILSPIFDGVSISIKMKDDEVDYEFKGSSEEVEDYFKETIYKRCRQAYNESPVAVINIVDTDNKTYVDYEVATPEYTPLTQEEAEIQKQLPETEEIKQEKEITKEIELLKARERVADKEILAQEAKQKTMSMVLDLLNKGFTREEIKNMIGF